jgi:CO/xanthine dehydrogenase FAD-binding subunit
MKASAFSYARPTSVSDALQLLVTHGDKAKVLSGGQSLVPAMNLRLISPEMIVDIGQIAELRGVTEPEPHEDQQASASMRRHLATVLLARCVSALLGRPDLVARASA